MAASSSLSSSFVSTEKNYYHVFISFRGEDTRRNFTSHLWAALRNKGLKTYMDEDTLEKGDEISPALFKAIEESKLSAIVLSENYASSSWCLNELNHILRCKEKNNQFVVPIFYHVDPSHVRHQRGSFADAFAAHEERFEMEKMDQWRKALTDVANLSGFHTSITGSESDAVLIEKIVKDIMDKLDSSLPSNDFKDLFGIEEHIEKMESLLSISSEDIRIVGIWGMGGLGKTTVARTIFKKISFQFQGSKFVENIKEEVKKHQQTDDLQKEVFSELLGEKKKLKVGSELVMDRLRNRKVLLVLDDVDHIDQLELLAKNRNWFGRGSRIIITTRDLQILRNAKAEIYEIGEMNTDNASRLFYSKAFQGEPEPNYIELSKKVVAYAKGIPLVLKVLGADLYSRTTEEWESELEKLNNIPNQDVMDVLAISYYKLSSNAKDIFLDIACFFSGEYKTLIEEILGYRYRGVVKEIRNLIDRSLLTITGNSYSNNISMHDLLRDMGREIVRKQSINDPGRRSRLFTTEDVCKVLDNNLGTREVQGMTIDLTKIEEQLTLKPSVFGEMRNLWFLEFHMFPGKIDVPENLQLPDTLMVLRWEGCPLKSLPPKFMPKNLIELVMLHRDINNAFPLFYSKAFKGEPKPNFVELSKKVVDYAKGIPLVLKVLGANLYSRTTEEWESELEKLKNIPNQDVMDVLATSYYGLSSDAKEIFLDIACFLSGESESSIKEILGYRYPDVDMEIRNLIDKSLLTIIDDDISMHDLLRDMGREIVRKQSINDPGRRSRLLTTEDVCKVLDNNLGTREVQGMTMDLNKIKEQLTLKPSVFEEMRNLWFLNFVVNSFPLPLSFPIKIGGPENLQLSDTLMVLRWPYFPLKSLPPEFMPKNLIELEMPESSLEELGNCAKHFKKLKVLNLDDSKNLGAPIDLSCAPNLERISLRGCSSIDKVPVFSNPRNIKYLNMVGTSIQEVPQSIECLSSLTDLVLNDCTCLNTLPSNIYKLKSLTNLSLSDCSKLECFPEIWEPMECLSELDLTKTDIIKLPLTIKNLTGLKYLDLSVCEKLENIPQTIYNLHLLEDLSISGCSKLISLPELPFSIKSFDARGCKSLKEVSNSWTVRTEGPPDDVVKQELMFDDCPELNQDNLMTEFYIRVFAIVVSLSRRPEFKSNQVPGVGMCFPGNEIPEWFKFQCEGSLKKMELAEGWYNPNFKGFAFCVVVSCVKDHFVDDLIFEMRFKTKDGEHIKTQRCMNNLVLHDVVEHVVMRYSVDVDYRDVSGAVGVSFEFHFKKVGHLSLSCCFELKSLPELPFSITYLDASGCYSLVVVSNSWTVLTQGPPDDVVEQELLFNGCPELNQDNLMTEFYIRVLCAIVVSLSRRQEFKSNQVPGVGMCFPGNEIPEWFKFQGEGSIKRMDLDAGWSKHNFKGFAFCVVLSGAKNQFVSELICEMCFETEDGERHTKTQRCMHSVSFKDVVEHVVMRYSVDVDYSDVSGAVGVSFKFLFENEYEFDEDEHQEDEHDEDEYDEDEHDEDKHQEDEHDEDEHDKDEYDEDEHDEDDKVKVVRCGVRMINLQDAMEFRSSNGQFIRRESDEPQPKKRRTIECFESL